LRGQLTYSFNWSPKSSLFATCESSGSDAIRARVEEDPGECGV
jgi:hypothetical protein